MLVKKLLISLFSFAACISITNVHAYEFSYDSKFIKINSSEFSEITLYIPTDQTEFISISENGSITNNSSNDIIFYSNDVEGSFIIKPFDIIRYSSDGAEFSPVTVIEVIDDNFIDFNILTANYKLHITWAVLFVGGVLCLVYLKH